MEHVFDLIRRNAQGVRFADSHIRGWIFASKSGWSGLLTLGQLLEQADKYDFGFCQW